MNDFPDVMVDIETTHTAPDRGAIIQLAAVRFSYERQEFDLHSGRGFFDRCPDIMPHRAWDESTRTWWTNSEEKLKVLQGIYSRMEPHRQVFLDFAEWCLPRPKGLVFWGKSTGFDFQFLQSHFRDLQIEFPFHFRTAREINSFISGLYQQVAPVQIDLPFEGDPHNALHDCIHQIKILFHARNERRQEVLV